MRTSTLVLLLVLGLLTVVAALVNARRAKGSREIVPGPEPVRAAGAERARPRENPGPSPMPAGGYDPWGSGVDLLDPHPLPLDAALAALARSAAAGDEAGRARLRRAITADEIRTLLDFSHRSAVFALREGSVEHVRSGLAALALIEEERMDDPREIFTALGLLHHAATRVGHDADALLRDAATRAEPGVARLFATFAAAPPAQPHPHNAGFHEVATEKGPGLVRWDLAEYRPTRDMTPLAFEVARLLESDRYAAHVTLAAQPPRGGLRGADERVVDPALRGARGAIRVYGQLRPGVHPTYEKQGLVITVVELADADRARALVDASRTLRPADRVIPTSTLAMAHGPFFCLLEGISFAEGVAPYETPESLARFAPALEAALARHAGGA